MGGAVGGGAQPGEVGVARLHALPDAQVEGDGGEACGVAAPAGEPQGGEFAGFEVLAADLCPEEVGVVFAFAGAVPDADGGGFGQEFDGSGGGFVDVRADAVGSGFAGDALFSLFALLAFQRGYPLGFGADEAAPDGGVIGGEAGGVDGESPLVVLPDGEDVEAVEDGCGAELHGAGLCEAGPGYGDGACRGECDGGVPAFEDEVGFQ